MTKKILNIAAIGMFLFMLFSVRVDAGPPSDAKQVVKPMGMLCSASYPEMLGNLITDYAVHISMIADVGPGLELILVENPDTKTLGILAMSESGDICLIFSGRNLKKFDRPLDMPKPKVDINDGPEDLES